MKVTEYLLSTNSFGTPKVIEGNEAINTLIYRLLLLEPNTIQSHPKMGIGLKSRYRYSYVGDFRDLQNEIEEQIRVYLPDLVGVKVNVQPGDKTFVIEIEINGLMYQFNFDSTANTLETVRTN